MVAPRDQGPQPGDHHGVDVKEGKPTEEVFSFSTILSQKLHHRPGVKYLIGVGMHGQLWGAGGASGVEVGGDIICLNVPLKDEAIRAETFSGPG
jgi:hypothetical protein